MKKSFQIFSIIIFVILLGGMVFVKADNSTIKCNRPLLFLQGIRYLQFGWPNRYAIDMCLYHQGIGDKSPKSCSIIQSPTRKDDCYWGVASSLSKRDICDNIIDVNKINSCTFDVARYSGDIKYCSSIPELNEYSKINCIFDVAYSSKNAEICNYLDSKDSKETCLLNVAEKTKDQKTCNLITDFDQKNTCYQLIK